MTETIKLFYNKFASGNPATNISREEFYTNLKHQTSASNLCVYLTNGTNKRLDNGGSGTTLGFQILSDKHSVGNLFDVSGAKIVFDSSKNRFEKKNEILATLSHSDQIWDRNKSDTDKSPKPIPKPYNGMYAGSVIRVDVSGTTNFPVCGGYHINGINLDSVGDKKKVETDSVGLVKAYYTAIMEDFFELATNAPSSSGTSSGKHYVLHLAQIPGDLYGGTEITGNAFHTAVNEWIASKYNVSPPLSVSMTISIDFEKPAAAAVPGAAAAAAVPDAADVPTPATGVAAVPTPATAATTSSVTKGQITELRARLAESKSKIGSDPSKTAAFTIAQEIFDAFFSGSDVKTNQTNVFLTGQVAKLKVMTTIFTDKHTPLLDAISKRLTGTAATTTSSTTTASAAAATSAAKPVGPTIKYVFAFDIDNTLVRHGVFVTTYTRSLTFNPAIHAVDYDKMLNLMKDIIDANHYVWIVTANSNISKADFDGNYLKGDTGKKIIASKNYYFMNPKTVDTDLTGFFDKGKISTYLTDTTALNLDFSTTDGGNDFQTKCLKPYAMIAKWLELKNPNMNDVKMYLFDDSDGYETTCKNVKDGKIEFVKISSGPSPSPPPPPPGFTSDVLEKATKKFNAISTTKTPVTSGGNNLNVMTFNTWYEALGTTPKKGFCMSGSTNRCQDNIRAAILAQMDKPGPVVIFLQEFTYKFEEFFEPDVTIDSSLPAIESRDNVFTPSSKPAIKAFRHFKIVYKGRNFYVYIGQIGSSVMATIYSSELADESATKFFMGNLASGMHPSGDKNRHEIVTTFSGDNRKLTTEDIKFGIKGTTLNGYDFNGGNRPFTILRFDNLKLILLNIHSPHNTKFGVTMRGTSVHAGAHPLTLTVADFAFNALSPFFTEHVFKGIDKTGYTFVAGGDFNAEASEAVTRLKPIFQDANNTIGRKTNTCCTDKGGTTFASTVDHIFSTLKFSSYTVYDPTKLEKTKTDPRYYFSDHLPVYATVTLPAAPAKAPAGPS
jgi:hypothetical protein